MKNHFSKVIKGKRVSVYCQSHNDKVNSTESWGAQSLCLWGCSEKILTMGHKKPLHAFKELSSLLEHHYNRKHKT